MSVDRIALRERMRSLAVHELREIARNRSGAHGADEMDVANEELTSRFSVVDNPLFENVRATGDFPMPIGLRVMFYLVSCVAAWKSLWLLFFLSVAVSANSHSRMLTDAILHAGVPAAWAIWVAFTIRSDHEYVRGLLLSLLSLAIIANIPRVLGAQEFSYWTWIVLGALVFALCYVAFSGSVRRYCGAMSGS